MSEPVQMRDGNQRDHDRAVGFRRRSRWGRRMLFLALVLGAVIFFAPIVISRTDLRHKVVPMLVPDLAGTVNVGTANLSWLSPAEFNDISVVGSDGEVLFEALSIASEKTLGKMAIGFTDVGTIRINQPQIHLALSETGTNFDEILASLDDGDEDEQEDEDDSGSTNVAFGVEIVDGTIHIRDFPTGEAVELSNVSMQLQSPKPSTGPLSLQLAADAVHRDERGRLQADFTWNQPAELNEHDLGQGALKLETQGLPMAALLPIYRRAQLDITTGGDLTGTVTCQWTQGGSGPELAANGELSIANAIVQMPSALGTDRLMSPVLTLAMDGAIQNEELQIHKLDSESDFGQLQIRGNIPLAELFASDLSETIATWKSRHRLRGDGRFDLRKIAESLPNTLRLRDDTSIVGGNVTLTLNSESTGAEARLISGAVTTADIVATTGGKTVSWTQPMDVQFGVNSVPDGMIVERFNCSSEFFQAAAAGTLAAGSFNATGDLDKLAAQLSQFCDIGASELAGSFRSEGAWSTSTQQAYEANANVTVENFRLTFDNLEPWQEQQLVIAVRALGKADGANISRIDAMQATIESGQDFFSAELTAPVEQPTVETAWPIDCKLRGQVASWLNRVSPWVTIDDWRMSGAVAATASGTVSPVAAAIQPFTVELTDLTAVSNSNLIKEPTIRATGAMQWDSATNRVALPTLEVVSSALALRGQQIEVATANNELRAQGSAAFRGDLSRLTNWLQTPASPATQNLRGKLEGTVNVATNGDVVSFQCNSNCAEFLMLGQKTVQTSTMGPQASWAEVWRETQLQLAAKGAYHNSDSTLQLEQLVLSGDAAQIQARGAIRQVTADPIAELQGEIDYDLLGLMAKIRNWVGPDVQLKGRQRQPFSIQGPLTINSLQFEQPPVSGVINTSATVPLSGTSQPLVHPQLSAEAVLGWDSASAYGVDFGPQKVSLMLKNSVVSTSPLESAVSGGTVYVAPRLDLAAHTPTLILDQNTRAQGVRLTPEMCEEWIKYVAPLLAGTATADGSLAMSINGASVPLSNPMMGEASGVILIEQARVQPGPMAQQLLSTFRQATTLAKAQAPSLSFLEEGNNWLEIEQQQVEFQVSQGRVYHRNLALSLGDVTVQTSGWVSMDQTMEVVAQVPVNDDWIKSEPALAGLRGQMIQIPIHGTLSNPQLDRRAFAQLSQQIIGSTAERMLHNELEKGLKKLLGPK